MVYSRRISNTSFSRDILRFTVVVFTLEGILEVLFKSRIIASVKLGYIVVVSKSFDYLNLKKKRKSITFS